MTGLNGKEWLGKFRFHIAFGWHQIVLSLLAGLAVTLLTVSYHAVRSAMINPAETLKQE